jgi:hypothetical protein
MVRSHNVLYFIYPFLLGLALSWAWSKSKGIFGGKSLLERAGKFGLFYFVIAGVPGMFVTYSSFAISLPMVLSWTISGLVNAVIAGWLFAKMNG